MFAEQFNIKHNKTTRHFQTQMDLSGQGKGMYFIEPICRRLNSG